MLQGTDGKLWGPPKGTIACARTLRDHSSTLGHLENDETPLQAAQRETFEEAGLSPNELYCFENFQMKITYDANGHPKDVYYYLAKVRSYDQSVKISDEHENWTWRSFEETLQLIRHPETNSVIQKANEFIRSQQQE